MSRHLETWMALALAALGLAAPAAGMGRKPPAISSPKEEKMTDVTELAAADVSPSSWSGSYSGAEEPGAVVVADTGAWQELWRNVFNKEAPAVDFARHFAVAAFAGPRNSGGFSVEFLPPAADGSTVVIGYRVKPPSPGAFVTMAFTQPFAIQLYRKTPLPVRVEERR